MFKNVASQKLIVFAFDSTTNAPKTGDAANITAYVSKDYGSVTVLTDTSATEMDSTNAKGYYVFDLTQGETNADTLLFSAKSSTSNIVVISVPATVFTLPATGILAPATAGRTLVVDASGLADANAVKVGPSGSGAAQTAKDLGAINVTNLNTLSSHDPGATIGTSTLTQAQVTGGAYALNSSSFSWNSALDFSTTQKTSLNAATPASVVGAVGSVTGNVGGNVTGSVGSVASGGITSSSFGAGAISAAAIADGAIDRATFAADTGLQTIRSGTCQATGNTNVTVKLDSGASSTDNFYAGCWFYATGGTGVGQCRRIESYDGTTKIATIDSTPVYDWQFFTVPDNTTTFAILHQSSTSVTAMAAQLFPSNFTQLNINGITGVVQSDVRYWNGTAIASPDTAGYPKVTIKSGTGTGEINLSSGLVALTSAYDFAKGTVAMTESYAALHAAPTPVQALFGITSKLFERSISGTTETTKKVDGSTTATTSTLNDATSPTSTTRAS